MPFIDQIKVGSTTRDIQDTGARTNEGTLSSLTTTEKGNLVGAINEVNAGVAEAKTQMLTKAEIDGYYESMTVGNAEQLVASVGVEDNAPYNFRTSGGSADIGDRLVDKLVGGTIVWNQLNKNDANTKEHSGVTFETDANGITTISGTPTARAYSYSENSTTMDVITGHVFLSLIQVISGTVPTGMWFGGSYYSSMTPQTWQGQWSSSKLNAIFKIPDGCVTISRTLYDITAATVTALDGGSVNFKLRSQLFNLTQMFGSTIADYIYSLEQANAGAGVAWFKKLFPKDYYAYNAGELMSVQAASHKTVGFNAWDEEWELGSIGSGGVLTPSTETIRSKNYIPVLPNTTYYVNKYNNTTGEFIYALYLYDSEKQYIGLAAISAITKRFTTPDNAYYLMFRTYIAYGTTYKNDICINLSWDGERDGEYEPYESHTYPLDDSLTLRGIPKLDASNNLYYDGDTYESDGTVTRRYGVYTFTGNESITYYTTGGKNTFNVALPGAKVNGFGAMSAKYHWSGVTLIGSQDDKTFIVFLSNAGPRVSFCDNDYTDTAAFASNITGITIIYELDTPTTETAEPYQNPQIVDDFGTEEYVDAGVTAATPTRDVSIPVGHETTYQANLRAKLEMAPDSPSDGDGDYIVRQTNGTNEYAKLVIPAELPTAPTTDGTYHLKATVSSGTTTLTWEADT